MAPYTAESTYATQSKANRPTPVVPRIVPAIPLALSRAPRASRPITPEDTSPAGAQHAETEAGSASGEKLPEEQHLAASQAPLTPESKASALSQDGQAEGTPASSSSKLSVVDAGETQDTRDLTVSAEQTEVPELDFSPTAPEPPRDPIKELPPPFYPSEHNSTPTSATSSAPSFQPPTNDSNMHHPRPSAGSIVFGGFPDSSNSSPAPPLGMGGYPAPPPGFVAGNYAPPPFFTPGHAHHPSDPNGHMMYPPMSMLTPGPYGFRRDPQHQATMGQHQPWYPHANPVPYQMMHQEPYVPRHESTLPNGAAKLSRSASQASSRTQDGALNRPHEPTATDHFSKLQNGNQPSTVDPKMESYRSELIDYTYSQFGNPDFADRILEVGSPGTAPFFSITLHSVIVARSPTLALALLSSTETYRDGLKSTQMVVEDKFITGQAITEAIKFLYGGPLPQSAKFSQGLQAFDRRVEQVETHGLALQRMDQALSFTAAGVFLQLPAVAERGIDIALHILRFDNIERALDFALHGGLSPSWSDIQSDPSSTSLPTYDPYSSSLLRGILSFIAIEFPSNFALNNLAPQLFGNPLTLNFVDSRPPTHHPRLSMIRFGEVPLEDTPRPTFATNLLSSILLSLPFVVLRSLFDSPALVRKVGGSKVVEVMNSVIEERENRRKKALKSQNKGGLPSGVRPQLLESLQWEERVEQSEKSDSGFCVVRSRKTANASAEAEPAA